MVLRNRLAVCFVVAWTLALAFGEAWWSQQPAAPLSRTVPLSGDLVATFSIVGFDPDTGDLGVAVQSKFFGVGVVVPFAEAGVGAVATQSYANTTFGPRGLELLRSGMAADDVIAALLADDPDPGLRQLGLIDAHGNAANHTGSDNLPWAGGRIGEHYAAQGNILAGPEVVTAMATTFETTGGDLASRLVAALAAGQEAGGDARGRQSAALLVVREGGGYGGFNDRFIDLRVDDHATPILELQRLLGIRIAQLRGAAASEALQAAPHAAGAERDDLIRAALADLEEATRLDPANGWHWMSLAAAHLLARDEAAAVQAGVRALQADPWVKTGILRGFGSMEVVEQLLEDDEFRRAWEQIQVRYRSP